MSDFVSGVDKKKKEGIAKFRKFVGGKMVGQNTDGSKEKKEAIDYTLDKYLGEEKEEEKDEKDEKKCPKCGGKVEDGKCTKCGKDCKCKDDDKEEK